MGDRAPLGVTIYHCPPTRMRQAGEIIEGYGIGTEFGGFDQPWNASEFQLGEDYVDHEASLTTPEELASDLTPLGCSFWITQDGKYEYPGTSILFTPDLGRFDANSDNDANITLAAHEIDQIINDWDRRSKAFEMPDLVEDLCSATGLTHRLHFAALVDLDAATLLEQSAEMYPVDEYPAIEDDDDETTAAHDDNRIL